MYVIKRKEVITMKLKIVPMLVCTQNEYENEVKPILKTLNDIDLCPQRNEERDTTWDCDTFEDCECCPFSKANIKIREALQIIKSIEVKDFSKTLDN